MYFGCRCKSKLAYVIRKFCSEGPSPLRSQKAKSTSKQVKHFVDVKRVRACGGKGGDGCISFLRLWVNDMAGPDGGNGGNGGHVVLESSCNTHGLAHVSSILKGFPGEKGYSKSCHGKSAPHNIVKVPVGTIVRDLDGKILADLDQDKSMFVLARGGGGGHGNQFFASSTEQKPLIAEYGAEGESLSYILELKSMAHFGLLGMPNAGKSTLLQAISRARPKIAPYPFTTTKPHIGVIEYDDYEQVFVADLPGLIEGSHMNRGLGIDFLRHADRCSALIFVVDASTSPVETVQTLTRELELFSKSLSAKPRLIVANKMDIPESESNVEVLKEEFKQLQVIPISAKYGTNLSTFLNAIRAIKDETDVCQPNR